MPLFKKKQPETSPSSPGLEHDRKVIGDFVRETLTADPDLQGQEPAVIEQLVKMYTDDIMVEVRKLKGYMGLNNYARAVGDICYAWRDEYRSA